MRNKYPLPQHTRTPEILEDQRYPFSPLFHNKYLRSAKWCLAKWLYKNQSRTQSLFSIHDLLTLGWEAKDLYSGPDYPNNFVNAVYHGFSWNSISSLLNEKIIRFIYSDIPQIPLCAHLLISDSFLCTQPILSTHICFQKGYDKLIQPKEWWATMFTR